MPFYGTHKRLPMILLRVLAVSEKELLPDLNLNASFFFHCKIISRRLFHEISSIPGDPKKYSHLTKHQTIAFCSVA